MPRFPHDETQSHPAQKHQGCHDPKEVGNPPGTPACAQWRLLQDTHSRGRILPGAQNPYGNGTAQASDRAGEKEQSHREHKNEAGKLLGGQHGRGGRERGEII